MDNPDLRGGCISGFFRMSDAGRDCDNVTMSAGPTTEAVGETPAPWLDLGRFRAGALTADRPMLLGVASRTATALGASVLVLRVGLVVLTLAAGWGLVVYAGLWAVLRQRDELPHRPISLRHNLGVIAATAAQLVFVDGWIGGVQPALLWPVALVAFAVALAEPAGPAAANRWSGGFGRVLAGAVLMVAGLFSALAGSQDLSTLLRTAPAALVLIGGLALVLTPWLRRLLAEADADRVRRAQAEARADMAAHLHDSVLQTLTLIQNRSAEPDIAAALAHRQERELRRWLYGAGHNDSDHTPTLRAALESTAAEVEDQYLKIVQCIVVGDAPMTEPVHAVVGATREAIVNAAKFADVSTISVYAEIEAGPTGGGSPGTVRAFVRDRGVGFDPGAVPSDRHGIVDSIQGRLRRVGGAATVHSTLGEGTEVRLRWPA